MHEHPDRRGGVPDAKSFAIYCAGRENGRHKKCLRPFSMRFELCCGRSSVQTEGLVSPSYALGFRGRWAVITSTGILADLKGGLNAKEISFENVDGRDSNNNRLLRAGWCFCHGSVRHGALKRPTVLQPNAFLVITDSP